jgi:PTS system mannose-specific IIA component
VAGLLLGAGRGAQQHAIHLQVAGLLLGAGRGAQQHAIHHQVAGRLLGAGMIGLVLVTHGNLAAEFIAAVEHVVGPQQAVKAICIGPDDDMEQRREEIERAVDEVETGSGVILLTDMFGGTPSNLAISLLDKPNVEVIAGMNLPMLIKLATVRKSEPLRQAVEKAQEAGRKYINVASVLLGSEGK